jgi:ABC-2 type transport system permease protein
LQQCKLLFNPTSKKIKMKKISLIIQREYFTRVRKKSFIVTTLLLPLLFLGLMLGTGYLAKKSVSDMKIAVLDSNNIFTDSLLTKVSSKQTAFVKVNTNPDSLKANFKTMGYDGYTIIPNLDAKNAGKIEVLLNGSKGEMYSYPINSKLNDAWNTIKLEKLGIDVTKKMDYDKSVLDVEVKNANDTKADSKLAGVLSRTIGMLIYFIILIYGSQVMMSVMEEKTNRIAEVVVSSVKPFQLMFGKIIGVGLVAITQFLLWIAFILIIFNVLKASGSSIGMGSEMIEGVQKTFAGINLGSVILFFIIYFIGGFFVYASLYAAIGSAVNEDIRDAQQLSFPVTMLIIFSLFVAQLAANDPNSSMAVWGSIIPFSSPFVMMSRIPFGIGTTVPWWQLIVSLLVMVGTIILCTWVSAKIYRTGILMYGKKVTFKEMIKWVRK